MRKGRGTNIKGNKKGAACFLSFYNHLPISTKFGRGSSGELKGE